MWGGDELGSARPRKPSPHSRLEGGGPKGNEKKKKKIHETSVFLMSFFKKKDKLYYCKFDFF